jgi:hypothetical protein
MPNSALFASEGELPLILAVVDNMSMLNNKTTEKGGLQMLWDPEGIDTFFLFGQ